ncbi:hypothetical protein CYMTET_9876 [Cymbomonas tetramitiformis]|uniref:Uncharacterized protein n=1 Tax=Cymbomonas tetramitiformis TaxID=36881 RepID=A0AAE0GQW4_9CHLO|nr:hypothetical protein CYMTET_9876 [Cymbomonas tetramitiformis]
MDSTDSDLRCNLGERVPPPVTESNTPELTETQPRRDWKPSIIIPADSNKDSFNAMRTEATGESNSTGTSTTSMETPQNNKFRTGWATVRRRRRNSNLFSPGGILTPASAERQGTFGFAATNFSAAVTEGDNAEVSVLRISGGWAPATVVYETLDGTAKVCAVQCSEEVDESTTAPHFLFLDWGLCPFPWIDVVYEERTLNAEGVIICQIPKLAKSVLSFDISDNPVWDAVPKLMQLMSHNIALTELNLGNTGCSNNAGFALANCLRENTTLQKLMLRDNKMSTSWDHISTSLETNLGLLILEVSYNSLGDQYGCRLAKALALNEKLITLSAEECHFGPETVKNFAEMLKTNTTLSTVLLDGPCGKQMLDTLATADWGSDTCRLAFREKTKCSIALPKAAGFLETADWDISFDGTQEMEDMILSPVAKMKQPRVSVYDDIGNFDPLEPLPIGPEKSEVFTDPAADSWFSECKRELNKIAKELMDTRDSAPSPLSFIRDCPVMESTHDAESQAELDQMFARASAFEKWVVDTEQAVADDPSNLTAQKSRTEAYKCLKDYHESAFSYLSKMAESGGTDPQLKRGFQEAIKQLHFRRSRALVKPRKVTLQIKNLQYEPPPPPPPPEGPKKLVQGYEDIFCRRLDDILKQHADPEEERLKCRELLRAHDQDLRKIFQHYRARDVKGFDQGDSAIDMEKEIDPDDDMTALGISTFEEGRLHTRQFFQFCRDTEIPSHVQSLAALNRLLAVTLRHPAAYPAAQKNPHTPFRNRVGYFEWVEWLFRASWAQYSKLKCLTKRMECFLRDMVYPKACKDSRDAISKMLFAGDKSAYDLMQARRGKLLKVFRYFSSRESAAEEPANTEGDSDASEPAAARTARASRDQGGPRAMSISNLISAAKATKKFEQEISEGAVISDSPSPEASENPAVQGAVSALSVLQKRGRSLWSKVSIVANQGELEEERVVSDDELDKPLNFNDILKILARCQMLTPDLNLLKTQNITQQVVLNKRILPQEHSHNTEVDIIFEEFVELLTRFALALRGAEGKRMVKEDGLWPFIDDYLQNTFYGMAAKVMPGRF